MPHNTDIFEAHEPWGGSLFASLLFHSTILGLVLAYGAVMGFHPNDWGGSASGGGAISVTLASAAAIPLPRETPTENIVANESTGITKTEPKQVAPPEPKAIEIPREIKTPPPKAKTHTTTERKPEPVQQATNVVPFGQNGQVRQNFSTFSTATGSGALSVGTGGDFGSRYSWYVDNVRRVVSQNWLMYEVDPHTTPKERVYLTFDIQRNGQPSNVRIERSSGIPSLDSSAVRALQRIDTFGPLPNDYRGGSVSAEFYFDYSPMHR